MNQFCDKSLYFVKIKTNQLKAIILHKTDPQITPANPERDNEEVSELWKKYRSSTSKTLPLIFHPARCSNTCSENQKVARLVVTQTIVILGGGTSGWMTAAALSRFLPTDKYAIRLIESDSIGTVGVGEATIPHIRHFNTMLGIDENDFIKETQATYKLAIQFNNWGFQGSSYMHAFGVTGHDINGIDFHHYWLRLQSEGLVSPYNDFSLAINLAKHHKFEYPSADLDSIKSNYTYAFHLDASLYASYLKKFAIKNGVIRTEGKVTAVTTSPQNGGIESLRLDSNEEITGQLFIDCSGFKGVLIEDCLKAGYESWAHWLPCDQAVAVASDSTVPITPYTQANALASGWQWRIPLQHRTGNGMVYASYFLSEDEATEALISNLDGKPIASPKKFKFTPGKRVNSWHKNCIAVGLSAGFLEPLESTSIYLVQAAILKLLEFFPTSSTADIERNAFNKALNTEYTRIRDFIILHYKASTRDDSPFWQACRDMSIPNSLEAKLELFKDNARISQYRDGLFMQDSWVSVLLGQGIIPEHYDERINTFSLAGMQRYLAKIKGDIQKAQEKMQSNESVLKKAVAGPSQRYSKANLSLYGGNE